MQKIVAVHQNENFFVPDIVNIDKTSQKLSGQRRSVWLLGINCKELTLSLTV